MEPPTPKLAIGDECDYCPLDSVWLAARVEEVSANGWAVRVRFCCGSFDVSHALDLRDEATRKRLAAFGTYSIPLLTGMHVDVLRRLCLGGLQYEQWQRADVVIGDDKAARDAGPSGGSVPVNVTATGPAVLGVSYPPSLVPKDIAPSVSFETPRAHWAPSGCFAPTWVPTLADVATTAVSTSGGAAAADVQLAGLGARARAAFVDSAAVTARLYAGGRGALLDYDLVDVLPLPLVLGGGGGGKPRVGRKSMSDGPARRGSVMPAPASSDGRRGSVSPAADARRGSVAPAAAASSPSAGQLVVRESPGAVLERPLAALAASRPALHARVHAGAGRGAFAPSPALVTPSSEALDGVPGGYRMLDRRTVRAWFPGRVLRARPSSGGGSDSPPQRSSSSSSSAASASEAYVYWFQPSRCVDGVGGAERFVLSLHCEPVGAVAGLAPAGTFSVPYVPGQAVEARTLVSPWAAAEVVYADRYCLRLRVPRPPPAAPTGSGWGGKGGGSAGDASKGRATSVVLHSRASGDRDGAAASSPLLAAALALGRQGAAATQTSRGGLPAPPLSGGGGGSPPAALADAAALAEGGADAAVAEAVAVASPSPPPPPGGRPPLVPKAPPRPPGAAEASPPAPPPSSAPPTPRRPRTSSLLMGIPQVPERGLETVPHQLWQLLLARPGHFCLRDGTAGAPPSAPPPPPSSGGPFGLRNLFSSVTSGAAAAPAGPPQAAVARALMKQGHRGSFA